MRGVIEHNQVISGYIFGDFSKWSRNDALERRDVISFRQCPVYFVAGPFEDGDEPSSIGVMAGKQDTDWSALQLLFAICLASSFRFSREPDKRVSAHSRDSFLAAARAS